MLLYPHSRYLRIYSEGLSPGTIKVYMAGIRHMQVTLGLPEPKEFSSLPRLRLVQEGIKRTHAQRVVGKERICLPITPVILKRLRTLWMGYGRVKLHPWVFQVGRDNSPIHPSSPSGMGGCICRQQSHANNVTNPPEEIQDRSTGPGCGCVCG